MYHIFFIHSSVDGHLGCFHVLAIVNSAAVNTGVHVSFQTMFFSRFMPRSGIAGSHGSSIFSSSSPFGNQRMLPPISCPSQSLQSLLGGLSGGGTNLGGALSVGPEVRLDAARGGPGKPGTGDLRAEP